MRNVAEFLSRTGREIGNRVQNTAVAVQGTRRSDTPGSFPTREDIELGVDEGARSNGIV